MSRRGILRGSLTHRTISFRGRVARYCMGEKSVASMYTDSTEAASRPSRLSSSNAARPFRVVAERVPTLLRRLPAVMLQDIDQRIV